MDTYGRFESPIRDVNPHKIPLDWIYNTTKYSFLLGCGMGIQRGALYVGTYDWKIHLREAARYAIPFTAMGLSYTTCTFLIQDYRGKEGKINHILGCLPALGIFNAWLKKPIVTAQLAPFLMIGASLYSDGLRLDWPHVFSSPVERGNFETLFWLPDTSLVQERKGWTY